MSITLHIFIKSVDINTKTMYTNHMSYWEFRVIRHKGDTDTYSVHRVVYDKEGNPIQLDSADSTIPTGTTTEELSHYMIHQMSALTKPVLDASIFSIDTDIENTVDTALQLLKKGK